MKSKPLSTIASALILSFLSTSCDKSAVGKASPDESRPEAARIGEATSGDLEELMKLPDSPRMMDLWLNNGPQQFPTDGFDVEPAKISVKRVSKDLFEVSGLYQATAKTDLYSFSVPTLVNEDGKTVSYMVTELLDKKGTKKVRTFTCQVRYGPMNYGRTPEKVIWNWENPKKGGDDITQYDMGGPSRWATADHLKITADGKASTRPDILVRGSADFQTAVAKHPQLAVSDEQRGKEESEAFDRLYEAMPRKSQ